MRVNERKTEDLVIEQLRATGYFDPGTSIIVEKQSSDSPRINSLLSHASKSGPGMGKPELIIRSSEYPDFLIVVECKASPLRHESQKRDKYADFAVDGALLYASFLSKEFDVLAIAVSGQEASKLRISHFLQLRKSARASDWNIADQFLPLKDYYLEFTRSDEKFRQDYESLLDYSREINNTLQAKKITEADRGYLISGILIALQNRAFSSSYQTHTKPNQLTEALVSTILAEFENAELPSDRRETLMGAFSFIKLQPSLNSDMDFVVSIIKGIDENINAFNKTHKFYDTIGHFYVEFLKYANNDKGLGIVLTPFHIAELFAELVEVNRDSIVYDNCCGTAGLLIAMMKVMMRDAGADTQLQNRIKSSQLYGIEFQPKIYALAVCNMILHGDGKTNIFRGDCFTDGEKICADAKPTIGVLNPPYKQKTVATDREELEFVLNNLECLQSGGKCIAILPITCATAPKGIISDLKRRLLERHTLEAVVSMPIELFHNSKTTVVTCAMIFTAKHAHPKGKKTWFGYWRDDGFVKSKHRGRTDSNNKWNVIKEKWISSFRNRETIKNFSVMKEVSHTDEWCAEAYLDTDYDALDKSTLKDMAKRRAFAQILNEAMLNL